jgi:hypothetical protein
VALVPHPEVAEDGDQVHYIKEKPTMTSGMRWRIFVLQIGLIGILGFVSGFAFWASNFATSTVHDQLAAQQIYFPAAGSAALTALPKVDDAAMTQYAGQQLLTSQEAQVYADNFINVHLGEIGAGKTYSQLSTEAQADPTNVKLAGEVATIFKGTTLRSMLLNAYGWGQIGLFAGYAAIGLAVAAFAVLGAFLFEIYSLVTSRKRESSTSLSSAKPGTTRVIA